ncbi:LysR family transcriptional regulator [Pseudenhygromyxa sp. WMMC2535]|uniref:LysR substrate-binding domain-containing protein n=1 Tax=Pseudenhygromyxa sp. WMMC2535 TaxID=2712867 RepID=UPI001555BA4B|nr:LysR substrate-binding domain-containing protein [Pseudenhygromyxa sp. WMMC2535]NVB40149.1 LysR family transcriptional regulator [Pseudenhygromyxa sp. WMMC2535]
MVDSKSDLNQLVIFAKVVEARSFTAAGRSMGLPKSTVSRKVAQLEERLGERLLERTTRRLSLTEVGAAFYERCARISAEIDEAERAVAEERRVPRGLLRVTAPRGLAAAFLADAVAEYLLTYPEVDLDLELTERPVDLLEEGVDLCICSASSASEPGVISTSLGVVRRFLVASPAYLDARGVPQHPEELERHDLVISTNPRRRARLELVGVDGDRVMIDSRPRMVVNGVYLLHEAVRAGVGVGVLPASWCAADIGSGRLVHFLKQWEPAGATLFARYPTSRHLSTKLRSFLDFLVERLEPEELRTFGAPSGTIVADSPSLSTN